MESPLSTRIEAMSKVAEKNGLRVYIPSKFGGHRAPYIKVLKAEHAANFTIKDGILRIGELPPSETKLINAYIEANRDALLAAFALSIAGKDPGSIPFDVAISSAELPRLLSIVSKPPYLLIGKFSDGKTFSWDMTEFIKELTGDLVAPLKDPNYFKKVSLIESGYLIHWPNGLDVEPEELIEFGEEIKVAAAHGK